MDSPPPLPDAWLLRVQQRLKLDGYELHAAVRRGDNVFDLVAQRSRFEMMAFGILDRIFVISRFRSLTTEEFPAFSARAFAHAKRAKKSLPPRGCCAAVWCFSVAAVDQLDDATADAIRRDVPPKHWAAVEFPSVFDRAGQQLHCFSGTPMWGALYFSELRTLSQRMLS